MGDNTCATMSSSVQFDSNSPEVWVRGLYCVRTHALIYTGYRRPKCPALTGWRVEYFDDDDDGWFVGIDCYETEAQAQTEVQRLNDKGVKARAFMD